MQNAPIAIPTEELTHLSLNESSILPDGAVITRISRYDFETSDNSAIDSTEINRENSFTDQTMRGFGGGGSYYYDYVRTYYLNNQSNCPYKADLHAKLKIYAVNSYAEIQDVKMVYSCLTPGSAPATWTDLGSGFEPEEKFPCGKVALYSDGNFTVNTQVTSGVDVSLLKTLGFSQSVSSSYI